MFCSNQTKWVDALVNLIIRESIQLVIIYVQFILCKCKLEIMYRLFYQIKSKI
jgi:hypothetical protein